MPANAPNALAIQHSDPRGAGRACYYLAYRSALLATIQPVAGQVTAVPPPPVGGPAPTPALPTMNVMPDQSAPAALLFRNAASVCSQ